jgi:hypothetical protein
MPRVGIEPTIPAFERAKTVHASDRAATVIGGSSYSLCKYLIIKNYTKLYYNLLAYYVKSRHPKILTIFSEVEPHFAKLLVQRDMQHV